MKNTFSIFFNWPDYSGLVAFEGLKKNNEELKNRCLRTMQTSLFVLLPHYPVDKTAKKEIELLELQYFEIKNVKRIQPLEESKETSWIDVEGMGRPTIRS